MHNDFVVHRISYGKELEISFAGENGKEILLVKFVEFSVEKMNIDFSNKEAFLVIDNFHRGRYEKDGILHDKYEGKNCYYLEFYGEAYLEILAKEITIAFRRA